MAFGFCGLIAFGAVVEEGNTFTVGAGVSFDIGFDEALTNRGVIVIEEGATLGVIGRLVNEGRVENCGRLVRKTLVRNLETRNPYGEIRYDVTRAVTGTIVGADANGWQVKADDNDSWHDAVDADGNPVSEPGDCIVCSYASSGVFENATNFNRDRRYVCSYSDISDAVLSFGRKGQYGRLIMLLRQVASKSILSGGRCELSSSSSPLTVDMAGFRWTGNYAAKFGSNTPAKLLNGSVSSLDITNGAKLFLVNADCGNVNINGKSGGVSVYVYEAKPSFNPFGDWSNGCRVSIFGGVYDSKSDLNGFTTVYAGDFAYQPSKMRLAAGCDVLVTDDPAHPYSVRKTPFDYAAELVVNGRTTYYENADTAIAAVVDLVATVYLHESSAQDAQILPGGRLTVIVDDGVEFTGKVSSGSDEYELVQDANGNATVYRMQVKPEFATARVNDVYFDSARSAIESIEGNRDPNVTVTVLKDVTDCVLPGLAETHYVLDLNGHSFAYAGLCSGHFVTVVDRSGGGVFADAENFTTELVVQGGVFTRLNPAAWLSEGLFALVEDDGFYHVTSDVSRRTAEVEREGVVTYYLDANAAIACADVGSTVRLYAEATAARELGANGDALTVILEDGGAYDPALVTTKAVNCAVVVERTGNEIAFTCRIHESEYDARIGDTYYLTLAEAILSQEGKTGNTIVLMRDVRECTVGLTNKNAVYTLDLNGYAFDVFECWPETYIKYVSKRVGKKTIEVEETAYYKTNYVSVVDGSLSKKGKFMSVSDMPTLDIVSITGGTFTKFDPTPYVVDGVDVTYDESAGTWHVGKAGEEPSIPGENPDDEPTVVIYASLQEELAAAPADGTPTLVKLTKDCVVGDFGASAGLIVVHGQNIVLDLMGHSIFGTGSGNGASSLFRIEGTLRVEDSSAASTGLISFASVTPSAAYETVTFNTVSGGQLVVAGGKALNATVGGIGGVFGGAGAASVEAGIFREDVEERILPRTRYLRHGDGTNEVIPYPSAEMEVMVPVVLSDGTDGNARVADETYRGEIRFPMTNDLSCIFRISENPKVNDRYAAWNSDFVITFDRDIPAKSVVLSARCPNFALAGNGWFSVHTGRTTLPAGVPRRMIQTATTMDMPFASIYSSIKEVNTGICNTLPANAGAKVLVELRLYEKDELDGTETGEYVVVSSCEYTLPDPRPAHIGEVTYPSVAEAVAAVDVSVRPDDYGTQVSVGRVPDVAAEITLQPGMTIDFGSITAEDVLKDLTFRSPDALHSVVPVMDATGLVQVGVRLGLSELAIPELNSASDEMTGDEIPAIDVGADESDEVLINAVETKKGLFYAVQCCDSLTGDKSGEAIWTVDGLWHEGNGKSMQLNASKGVSGSRFYRITASDDPRVLRYKGEQK